jgi:hypothetical protein
MNWKTTIPGVVAGLAQIAKALGLNIEPAVLDGITAIAIVILAFYAKDKDVTGGTKQQ